MSGFHRTERWRLGVSLPRRVRDWKCRVCGLVPSTPRQLEAAHLVAVSELRRDCPHDGAALFDPDNIVSLCIGDHKALDYLLLVGVRDPARLSASQKGKLYKRIERYGPEFAALLRRRMRYRDRLRRERADVAAPTVAPLLPAASEEQLIDHARARFDRAMAAREVAVS